MLIIFRIGTNENKISVQSQHDGETIYKEMQS